MTVWVVLSTEITLGEKERHIYGVFSTKDKAKECQTKLKASNEFDYTDSCRFDIYSFELDKPSELCNLSERLQGLEVFLRT